MICIKYCLPVLAAFDKLLGTCTSLFPFSFFSSCFVEFATIFKVSTIFFRVRALLELQLSDRKQSETMPQWKENNLAEGG